MRLQFFTCFVLLRSASASRRPTWVLDLRTLVPDALRTALGEALFTVVNGRESFLTHGWEGGRFRYNPTCMRPATKRAAAPWQAVHEVIAASSATPVYWEPGRTLVIDNWRCVHAQLVGAKEAEPLRKVINDFHRHLPERVKRRIAVCKARFLALPPEVIAFRKGRYTDTGDTSIDDDVVSLDYECPACGCFGTLSGDIVHREERGGGYDDPWGKTVDYTVSPDLFECAACDLRLRDREEVEAAGLGDDLEVPNVEEVQREWDEYGDE